MPYNAKIIELSNGLTTSSINDSIRSVMRTWWYGCKVKGEIFTNIELCEEGITHIGRMPWPDFVALSSLEYEFRKYVHNFHEGKNLLVPKPSFANEFRKIAGVTEFKRKRIPVKLENGTRLYYRTETFYNMNRLSR